MKSPIPGLESLPPQIATVLRPIKQWIETVRGERPNTAKIEKLGPSASTNDLIRKVNEIIDRLQS